MNNEQMLREALERCAFALRATDTCLKTWNDGRGSPANVQGALEAAETALAADRLASPPTEGEVVIDMLLYCPTCGLQHIDEPDERTPDWANPPHRSHLCHGCGCIWRPADVATNGVRSIASVGKADTWAPTPLAALTARPQADAGWTKDEIAQEIERYGQELVPGLRTVCTWLAEHFRTDAERPVAPSIPASDEMGGGA